jgi:hypothetical protein
MTIEQPLEQPEDLDWREILPQGDQETFFCFLFYRIPDALRTLRDFAGSVLYPKQAVTTARTEHGIGKDMTVMS